MSEGELRRWYNPPWFSEHIPSTPYDPRVLREAFEKASSSLLLILNQYHFIFLVFEVLTYFYLFWWESLSLEDLLCSLNFCDQDFSYLDHQWMNMEWRYWL